MEIKRLDSHFGAEVLGVDLGDFANSDRIGALTRALYENRVVIIRDQSLTQENYLKFGQHWGDPIPHVLDHLRSPRYPALMVVGNTEDKDRVESVRNGTALWHTDQSYEANPASATMLYAIKVPTIGGETQICNMVAAYQDLDQTTKRRLDSLQVAHQYGRSKLRSFEFAASPITTPEQRDRLPTFYHPLVMRHHITGEKTLYGVGQSSYGIMGMEEDRAVELLEQLKDHVLQEKYIYRHKYRVGDVAIWDTFQTLHSGREIGIATCEEDSRILWRISVRGKPRIYRC